MRGCPEAGDGIAQPGSLGKLLRPTDGGGRGLLDEAWPLLYRAAPHHGGPSPRGLPARLARAPAVDEGAGISRIGQDGAHRLCGGLAPSHVVGSYAVAVAPGQEDLLLLAGAQDLESGAAFLKLAQDQSKHMLHLSQCLPDLWSGPQLSHPQRKALLRSLISRVMVKRTAADRVEVKIIWVSGHFSEGIVIPPVLHQHHVTGYDTMVERTRQLWAEGYSDLQIADVLSREGFRSARRETVLAKTVMKRRHRHQWVSPYHQHRCVDTMDEQWTSRGLARELGVAWGWVSNRMRNGLLREPEVSRRPPHGNVLIRDDAEVLRRLRVEVTRSRRLRKTASPPSMPPEPGESLGHAVEGEWV